MDLVRIWFTDRYKSKVCISNILPWLIGHKGKKPRSQDQLLENSFDPVFMKICQNVCHQLILAKFETGSCLVEN